MMAVVKIVDTLILKTLFLASLVFVVQGFMISSSTSYLNINSFQLRMSTKTKFDVSVLAAFTGFFWQSQWMSQHNFMSIKPAQAAIANLADVGIREFLVKDGRQFLRLSIPLGDDQHFVDGETNLKARNMNTAQENLELVKLRFEQVGYTNPSVWGNALKDANSALSLINNAKEYLTNSPVAKITFENDLQPNLNSLISSLRNKEIANSIQYQENSANALANIRLSQLPPHSLPYSIPNEYVKAGFYLMYQFLFILVLTVFYI